jgi:hypothetical protein
MCNGWYNCPQPVLSSILQNLTGCCYRTCGEGSDCAHSGSMSDALRRVQVGRLSELVAEKNLVELTAELEYAKSALGIRADDAEDALWRVVPRASAVLGEAAELVGTERNGQFERVRQTVTDLEEVTVSYFGPCRPGPARLYIARMCTCPCYDTTRCIKESSLVVC